MGTFLIERLNIRGGLMSEERATRSEMNDEFIEDTFFEKGHVGLKVRQLLITILAWFGLLLPFGLVLFPILFFKDKVIVFDAFQTAIRLFQLMDEFLLAAAIFIVIFFLVLTYRNNKRFKNLLQKKKTYDEEILDTRKADLEQYFTENFGPKEEREATKFISIPEEKNMQTSTIRDLYEENGVPLS